MTFWQGLWSKIVAFFTDNAWSIIMFVVIAVLGLLVIKIVLKIIRNVFSKAKWDSTLGHFIVALVKFMLLMLYIITLLSLLGVPITSLVAIITAISLALALAVQTSLSSLAYGIILIAARHYREGEYVEIDGTGGTVERISMVSTVLKTPQGQIVNMPHSKTASAVIVNYTKEGKRRLDIPVQVEYGCDIDKVKRVLSSVYESDDRVLEGEEHTVFVKSYTDSAVEYNLRVWTLTDNYWQTLFDMNEKILVVLAENNLIIPYKTLNIHMKGEDANLPQP